MFPGTQWLYGRFLGSPREGDSKQGPGYPPHSGRCLCLLYILESLGEIFFDEMIAPRKSRFQDPGWIICKKPCNSHFSKFCDAQLGVGFESTRGPVSAVPPPMIRRTSVHSGPGSLLGHSTRQVCAGKKNSDKAFHKCGWAHT